MSTLPNLWMWVIWSLVVCLYIGNLGYLKYFPCVWTNISTESGELPKFDYGKEFKNDRTWSFFVGTSATSSCIWDMTTIPPSRTLNWEELPCYPGVLGQQGGIRGLLLIGLWCSREFIHYSEVLGLCCHESALSSCITLCLTPLFLDNVRDLFGNNPSKREKEDEILYGILVFVL